MDARIGAAGFPTIQIGLRFFQALEAFSLERCVLGVSDGATRLFLFDLDLGSGTAGRPRRSESARRDRVDSERDRRCRGRARLRADCRAPRCGYCRPVDERLSRAARPRCESWSGRSASVPPCGCSRASARTIVCVDICRSADRGPSARCRNRLGTSSPGAVMITARGCGCLVSAKLANEAFDGLIAAVEPALGHQVLPDRHGIATLAQTQLDRLTERFAETGGRNGLGRFMLSSRSTPRQTRWSPHSLGRFCGSCFCFSLRGKVFGVGVGVDRVGRFCRVRPGGHPFVGRFCRRSPSPRTRRAHSDPGRFQVGSGGLPTHPGLLLDAPQGPSEPSQGYDLLFFRFAQDVAHTDEGYCLASESTSPSLILVGRFSGDPHWPLLGDP